MENELRTTKKRRIELGQHHLIDSRIISAIIHASKIEKDDVVLELGTGNGQITRQLSGLAQRVYSYEVDYGLYRSAQKNCLDKPNIKIYNVDLLESNPKNFNLFISNIPYSLSKEVVKWLCLKKFRNAVIMVQDEFATKLVSHPGGKNFSAISVIAQYCFRLELLSKVPPDAFFPTPLVMSRVIRMTPRNKTQIMNPELMMMVEQMFSNSKRKLSDLSSVSGKSIGRKKIRETDPDTFMEFLYNSKIWSRSL
ncbi:MAG: 16S rRNA (adenine(1518)-N(6)/adenine(1519)-N(6))-dimethyltransferase RsmA [Thermoproteota archaeon]|nr:16S rRNA (adenine(1518)-N(6)/adenine(1519)-N(6))-dimethyltransferase RsmA [Thermoproteota archaeon]